MADAEKLLQEAQYAFNLITYGESRANRRNAAKATALARKIIRRYPDTTEAYVARSLLRRLGLDGYQNKFDHTHTSETGHRPHRSLPEPAPKPRNRPDPLADQRARERTFVTSEETSLDWGALIAWLFKLPKFVWGFLIFAGVFLFTIFGPFLLIPLVLFVLFTGPLKSSIKGEQQQRMNEFVARVNEHLLEKKRRSG